MAIWYLFRRKVPGSYRPVILITGCGSGIGLAIADVLYENPKYRLVLTAREKSIKFLKDRFQSEDRVMILPLDVTYENQRQWVINEVKKRWGAVNILINNAGISYRSVVEHMSEDDEYRQMQTNYFGPMGLIRLVLPMMRTIGRGKIISISSVSGMLAMPTMAAYSASKHALEGASEALWYEAKPYGITVSLVQPGFIRSNSFENVYYSEAARQELSAEGPYTEYYKNMAPFVAKLMRISPTTPEGIARLVLKVIQTQNPPLWITATYDASFFYYLRRMLPRRILLPFLFAFLPGARRWGKKFSKKRKR